MIDKFENLPEDKKRKIINAAYKIFSTYGYKKASTNEITAQAGISKGLLFHYFKSKLGLYIYLYNTSLELIKNRLYEDIDTTQADIIKRLRDVITSKLELVHEYPDLLEFLKSAYFEQELAVIQLVQDTNNKILKESYQKLYSNIDISLFREGIDWQMAVQAINSTLEKWSENYILQFKNKNIFLLDQEAINKELNPYFDFFIKSFYR